MSEIFSNLSVKFHIYIICKLFFTSFKSSWGSTIPTTVNFWLTNYNLFSIFVLFKTIKENKNVIIWLWIVPFTGKDDITLYIWIIFVCKVKKNQTWIRASAWGKNFSPEWLDFFIPSMFIPEALIKPYYTSVVFLRQSTLVNRFLNRTHSQNLRAKGYSR